MSTPNFYYKNRCVVVEDYEGMMDRLGKYIEGCNRNYPSYEILTGDKEQNKLQATKIVLTAGYYRGNCIDFIQNTDWIEDFTIDLREKSISYGELAELERKELEKILKREARIANRIINRIKKEYGYKEVKCIAIASNGAGFYREVK